MGAENTAPGSDNTGKPEETKPEETKNQQALKIRQEQKARQERKAQQERKPQMEPEKRQKWRMHPFRKHRKMPENLCHRKIRIRKAPHRHRRVTGKRRFRHSALSRI